MKKIILIITIFFIGISSLFSEQLFNVERKGWNLKGFYYNLSTDYFNQFAPAAKDNISTIWKWYNNKWIVWSPDAKIKNLLKDFNINSFTDFKAGEGFWIYAKEAFQSKIFENQPYFKGFSNLKDFLLNKKGWHLISSKAASIIIPNSLFVNQGIKTVWKWNINKMSWEVWSPDPNILKMIKKYGMNYIFTIDPDDGFWVNTDSPQDFVVKARNIVANYIDGAPFVDYNGDGNFDNGTDEYFETYLDSEGYFSLENLGKKIQEGTIFSIFGDEKMCNINFKDFYQTVYIPDFDKITFNSITTLIATIKRKYVNDNISDILEKVKKIYALPQDFDPKYLLGNPYEYFLKYNYFDFYKKALQFDRVVKIISAFATAKYSDNLTKMTQIQITQKIYQALAEILYNNGNVVTFNNLFDNANSNNLIAKLKQFIPNLEDLNLDVLYQQALNFGKNFYAKLDNLTQENLSDVCNEIGTFSTFQEFAKGIVSENLLDNLSANFDQKTFMKYMEMIYNQIKTFNSNLSYENENISFISQIACTIIDQFKNFDNATLYQFASSAFVFIDENKNGIMDLGEKIIAMLDESGLLDLANLPEEIKKRLKNGDVLGLIGGFALNGDYLKQFLSTIYMDNLSEVYFTPISTFITSLVENGTELDEAVEIAKKFLKLSDNISVDDILKGIDTNIFMQNIKISNMVELIIKLLESNMGNLPEIEKFNIKKNVYEKILEFIKNNKNAVTIDDILTDENLEKLMNTIKQADGFNTVIQNGDAVVKAMKTLKVVNDKMAEITGDTPSLKDLKDYQLMSDTLIDLFVNIINDGDADELENYSKIFAKGALKDLKEIISKVSKTKNLFEVKNVLIKSKEKLRNDINALVTLYNFNQGGENPFSSLF